MQAATYNRSVDVITMPQRIRCLPISPQGWPVPHFVTWFDGDKPCDDGEGVPDFRVVNPDKITTAVAKNRCWVCGQTKSTTFHAFVIGPMCAINRVISEPSSHRDCAIYAARVCPFLAKPNMVRNEKGMYDEDGKLLRGLTDAAGIGLKRNPGACCVYVTKSYRLFRPHRGQPGVLFSLGTPVEVMWFAEGKRATREQIMASIDSGYPKLEEIARQDGRAALAALKTQYDVAMALVPNQ